MLEILRQVTVTCFFASYLVVLALELLRLLGKFPGRALLVVVMMVMGLFTHICYLVLRAADSPVAQGLTRESGLWASWTDWSLLMALVLAICFFVFYLRRPDTVISYFFLPAVMGLIGFAVLVRDRAPFTRTEATELWRSVHGLSMMIGSVSVLIGFLAGVMYLTQSRRLKQHRAAGSRVRLPTLETLGKLNRRSLVFSTIMVGIGVIAGVVMNLNRWGQVGWTNGGVLLSSLLLVWLIIATAIEFWYQPANRGRKAVYLTLASLGFLILAMIGVLGTEHGQSQPTPASIEETQS
ncbi:cytochrome c biogenesis protein CcsA [Rubripirellula amarantea]|uniref:Cytochrome C assembly protein n=1 Tax=Rubripirellula amarantea TaxID=2527999 RepID=A0A5C5WTZ5_9BACT|nr:cytochrome c biogenesis protein CcsA [Rubripirellula amarantea]MDA8743156.1 cytochrome c biogenesis protein CcsA [Rubripirellula amarantea]TWT53493.1 Cytochrome C assembly protein [Rubripirellula amarantea]